MQGCLWASGTESDYGRGLITSEPRGPGRAGRGSLVSLMAAPEEETWRHVFRVRPRERGRGGLCLEAVGSSQGPFIPLLVLGPRPCSWEPGQAVCPQASEHASQRT